MKRIMVVAMVVSLFMFGGCGGSDSGGDTDTDPATQTFTSGGTSLAAATTATSDTMTTTVTDSGGTTVLTQTLTVGGVSNAYPGQEQTADTTFTTPLASLPTNYAANVLATYVAGQISSSAAAQVVDARGVCLNKDSPGCDWFPDTQCTLGCCADHDYCYDLNGCGASSWLIIGASDACINCNGIAEICITRACAAVDASRTDDRCYDNRCHQFYDCGVADCYTCTSPCDEVSPTACTSVAYTDCCGNGSCELGETVTNCPGDCTDGSGYNTCCLESGDCPSETLYTCPGACCCCGMGEVCTTDGSHVCTGSAAAMTVRDAGGDILGIDVPEDCLDRPKSECK